MKKTLIALALCIVTFCAYAQKTFDGQKVAPRTLGIFAQYDEASIIPPAKAPKGYKVCYLTHYGRHGARYMVKNSEYDSVMEPLKKAAAQGNLTALGQQLFKDYSALYEEAYWHPGELTELGQKQHRAIAARMVSNHPALFKDKARIEVRSTNLERTMLSMFACCTTLQSLQSGLQIHADASASFIHTINPHAVDSRYLSNLDSKCRHRDYYPDFLDWGRQNVKCSGILSRLFKNPSALEADTDAALNFVNNLYYIACISSGMDTPQEDYFKYFTADELESLTKWDNMFYYKAKGPSTEGKGRKWRLSKYILEDIVNNAEKDMSEGVSARLRFGHDGCMMALFCMMGIDGWCTVADNLDKVWDVWDINRIPMASNLQIAFYKNASGEILVEPRLNERPMKLPFDEVAPGFYSWKAFKEYYNPIIEESTKILEETKSL